MTVALAPGSSAWVERAEGVRSGKAGKISHCKVSAKGGPDERVYCGKRGTPAIIAAVRVIKVPNFGA